MASEVTAVQKTGEYPEPLMISEEDYRRHIVMQVYNQLTVNETRLFMVGVDRLQRTVCGQEVHIPAAELVGYFGGNKGYYSELGKVCEKLSKRSLMVRGRIQPVFSYIRFSGKDEGLYMHFNPAVVQKLLLDYQTSFLKEAFRLKSIYAIRLLEFLHHYIDSPGLMGSKAIAIQLGLEDFKRYLGVPNTSTYLQITNIINKIINHSLQAIHQNTGYRISYKVIKEKRRVTGFLFAMQLS